MMMLFDASAEDALPESIQTQCQSLRGLSMGAVQIQMSSLKTSSLGIQTQIKPNDTGSTGGKAQFMLQYIEQVDKHLCLIGACRSGD